MLTPEIIQQLTEKVPDQSIKEREGSRGMRFKYVSADFVIKRLNSVFKHAWDTEIVKHELLEGNRNKTAIVHMRLRVSGADGSVIIKEQFGSCDINGGVDIGSALKGAASDALKKCATLLGVCLDLYEDDEAAVDANPASGFTRPNQPLVNRAAPAARPVAAPMAAPAQKSLQPAPRPAPAPAAPAAPASTAPRSAADLLRSGALNTNAAPRAPRFGAQQPSEGGLDKIKPPQLSTLVNLANVRGLSAAQMLSQVNPPIVDAHTGHPISSFEDLTGTQALQVIKALRS